MNAYTPDVLWMLRHLSPKRARLSAQSASVWMDGSTFCKVNHADGFLAVSYDRLDRAAVWITICTEDASPRSFADEARALGLHLRAAMTKDVLWRARHAPMDEFVIVATEKLLLDGINLHDDRATYQMSEALMAEGEVEYRRALKALDDAVRDGWPGWDAKGTMVLE